MEDQLTQFVEAVKSVVAVWGQVVLAASILIKYIVPEIKEGGWKTLVKFIGKFIALNR